MTKPFNQFTYDDAVQLFGRRVPRDGTITYPAPDDEKLRRPARAMKATDFLGGNHWQNGLGFIGELPSAVVPFAAQIIERIRLGFVSENVIQEVVETHTGGILGREPTWGFLNAEGKVDKADKKSFESVTGETLTQWWNQRLGLRNLQKAISTLVCEGRVVRRLFFPRKLKGQTVTAATLADALKLIHFSYHTADVAGVFTDEDTQADIGVFLFEEKADDGTVLANCAELSYLDASGNTVCKIVRDKGGPTEVPPYPLGGHLLLYELQRTPLITDQVQSNQRALNLAHTMMMRNVNMAGSRERIITNAKPPINVAGQDVHSNRPPTQGTHKTGPGAVNYIQGWPLYSDDGGKIVGYTDPNVTIADPVAVTTFVETAGSYRSAIYSQCHQRHVLIVDKADTSGRAREVARREFERSLKETKILVDGSIRWQLEGSLRLAAYVISEVEKYANLRADANCLIDAGEPDPEKQKTASMLRQPGGHKGQPLLSDETTRAWIGVEDPAAELAMIEAEAKKSSPADNPEMVGGAVPGQSVPGSKTTSEAVN